MLINCVAYEDGRKLADIAIHDIDQWLRKPGCFVWVALRDATDEELCQMQVEVRPSRVGRRGRPPRPPAAQD